MIFTITIPSLHLIPITVLEKKIQNLLRNSKWVIETDLGVRERAVTRCCRRLWQRTRSGKHDHLERKWWPQGRILFLCCSYSCLCLSILLALLLLLLYYMCVFLKTVLKVKHQVEEAFLVLVYRYFFLLKKYGKCFFFFFFFQTFAIFGLHKLEGDGRWDSFFFFLGPIRKFHWYEPA